LFLEHQVPLPKAIAAELLTLAFRSAGPITSYHDRGGSGRPLVLIHSINAAASSYEMRPLFQHYRGQRPVYALDFPGFGFSARPNTQYKPDTFVDAILTLLTNLEGGPADVVALSLGSEFAAEAARRRPELFHSLAVLSPTGMYQRSSARSSQSAGNEGYDKWLYPLLSLRLWARPFYDLLTVRRSLTYFLQRSFVGAVPDGMVDYAYSTSHQPGAEHAPLYFVSGKLFTPDAVDRIYRHVTTPSLAIYDQDSFVSFDRLPQLVATNNAWRSVRIAPTLGMPHWEKLEETTAALDNFWQGVEVPI
jgi:pimeloyl-ACP methyl ester carboxylesterase